MGEGGEMMNDEWGKAGRCGELLGGEGEVVVEVEEEGGEDLLVELGVGAVSY